MTTQREESRVKRFAYAYSHTLQAADNHRKARGILFDTLPESMKEIRKKSQRMTQKQLAEALEVDHSYISKIESGQLQPGMEFLGNLYAYVVKAGLK